MLFHTGVDKAGIWEYLCETVTRRGIRKSEKLYPMKRSFNLIVIAFVFVSFSEKIYSQEEEIHKEFGVTAGAFGNFPANKDYLDKNIKVFYVAPYVRAGQHEFSAGLLYPLKSDALFYTDSTVNPRLGFTAGYKFYIFNAEGRENLFIHYAFQYLRFHGSYNQYYPPEQISYKVTETDMYINNVIGLGYHIFFDMNGRFGLYYILDYVISQAGYNGTMHAHAASSWSTNYIWNNLSTNVGFIFKIKTIKSKTNK
jgi:hypothetical protein